MKQSKVKDAIAEAEAQAFILRALEPLELKARERVLKAVAYLLAAEEEEEEEVPGVLARVVK